MAEQNADLLKQAEELGIKVDKRWADETLQQMIDQKLLESKPADPLDHDGNGKKGGAAPALVAVRILRDIWLDNPDNPAEPIRYREGSVREVSMNDAFDGIESGAFSRVK